jgi:hypothetical protein
VQIVAKKEKKEYSPHINIEEVSIMIEDIFNIYTLFLFLSNSACTMKK